MKVVCLVPSWTETLIEAGINVVGRTRFCIHPSDRVKNIAIVGGTKNIDIQKILNLKPDIVLLDKEENTTEIANLLSENNIKWLATHVCDLSNAAFELSQLSIFFNNNLLLKKWSEDYKCIVSSIDFCDYSLEFQHLRTQNLKINYVIWKNPWMCVSKNTFIGAVLEKLGLEVHPSIQNKKYFEISESDLKNTYCLFSSEPFAFEKEITQLLSDGFQGELVNGESYSWFGLRNLKFMMSLKVEPK